MDLQTFKKFFQKLSAQSMVEFALVLPILLLLVFGVIEAGRLLFLYSAVMSASREAVRYGSASGEVTSLKPYYDDCSGIQNAAMRIGKFAGVSAGDVTISYDNGPGTSTFATCPLPGGLDIELGDRIVVHVVTTWTPLLPLVNFSGFPVTSQSSRTIIKDVQIQGTPPPPIQPTVAFMKSDQTVNEGDGQIKVNLRLDTSTVQTVSVPFSVSGTAANGVDFTISGSPVIISPGKTLGQITIDLNDDNIDEEAETVILTMGTPAHANKGTPSVHTMTIEDNDDPPKVSFQLAAQGYAEDVDGIAMLVLSNPSVHNLTVDYSVSGSAQGGFDYTTTASPITVPAMDTSFPIVIDVIDDLIDEEDEQVIITINAVTNGTIGSPKVHTYTIFDNDDPPDVFFTWADQSVEESDITIQVELQLSIESSKVITVPFGVGGTATKGPDYSINMTPIVLAPGETTASIPVQIYDNDDLAADEVETIIVTILPPGNATIGSPSVHTITINSSNPPVIPVVSFASASQTSNDGSEGVLSVKVVLSAPPSMDVIVPFSVTGGTATLNVDYSIASSPVTIPAGGASATIKVTMYDDSVDENDETIQISLGNPTNATKGSPSVHTITIYDDDPEPQLSFTSTGQKVDEDYGTVTITAQLNVMSGKTVTVPFNVVGTAQLGLNEDYLISTSPVTITAGNTSVDILLDVLDDDDIEPDEEVVVTLNPPTNAILGAPAQFTLTILDNEPPNCPISAGQPIFGTGANKNTLTWTIQSLDPLVPVNLTEVTIHWPAASGAYVTSITFGAPIFTGSAPPIFLAVNSPYPLWSGAFDTRQLVFVFDKSPQSVAGNIYQLGATFEGCPPVGETIPSG